MIQRDYSNSTTAVPTGCTRNCRNCTMYCTMIVIFMDGTDSPTAEELRAEGSFYDTELPDKTDDIIYPITLVDIETIRFWRKTQKKSRFRNVFNHKPLIKRRMSFSKSGWLATKGRLRKRGKK